MIPNVYLAGPISGLTYSQAENGWREEIRKLLPDWWNVYSPLRGKQKHLGHKGKLFGSYPSYPMTSSRGILARDRNDVKRADLVIACFHDCMGRPSIGTVMEIAWADANRVPVIMVANIGDPHREHPMLEGVCSYVVDDIEDAVELAFWLFHDEKQAALEGMVGGTE